VGTEITIRQASVDDAVIIQALLSQLDYVAERSLVAEKMQHLLLGESDEVFVAEKDSRVVAFIALHYIPQLPLEGDFARITYFCVTETVRSLGVGKLLEEHAQAAAARRGCDRIELHCHSRRTEAHRFYQRLGYLE